MGVTLVKCCSFCTSHSNELSDGSYQDFCNRIVVRGTKLTNSFEVCGAYNASFFKINKEVLKIQAKIEDEVGDINTKIRRIQKDNKRLRQQLKEK